MEDVRVKEWLSWDGGYGNGNGNGNGYGYGNGFGNGGNGNGNGNGGYGYGNGNGYGGYGNGFGNGDYGNGNGNGNGYGNGKGGLNSIKQINCYRINEVDYLPTIITHIHNNIAKGFIVHDDLTFTPCYVAKGNGYFAHGETIKAACEALESKIFENLSPEETIEKFIEHFRLNKKYKGKEFYDWHHYLTGSCEMGRDNFAKTHGISLDDELTVAEFIKLTKDAYGGEIIKQLERRIKE